MEIHLRDYQQQAVNATIEKWKEFRKLLIVLPTGCGKTIVFASLIKELLTNEPHARALVLAHREELIYQAADKIGKVTGKGVGIEMGEVHTDLLAGVKPPVIVSTVQTQNAGRKNEFDPKEFKLLIIDEAHHAVSKIYRKTIAHYLEQNPDCKLLGVTATPKRKDKSALGKLFDEVSFSYTISDAIGGGWLVPIKQKMIHVDEVDFSKVDMSHGDLNPGQLAEVMEDERALHAVATPTIEICKDMRTIIFAASVKQAERLAEIIRRHNGKSAEFVSGETPKGERQRILERFNKGKTQFLCNVGVLTEGFDSPGVECVVMARPTASAALYTQIVGRGMRPAAEIAGHLGNIDAAALRRKMIADSKKPSCLVLDFVGNSCRHQLVSSVDILGGDYTEQEKARAKKKIESGEVEDTEEALSKSRAEIEAEKKAAEAKRHEIVGRVKYLVMETDVFSHFNLPAPTRGVANIRSRNGYQLSHKQKEYIRNTTKENPDNMSYQDGLRLLNAISTCRKINSATYLQSKSLARKGIHFPMSRDKASQVLADMAQGRSWKGWN